MPPRSPGAPLQTGTGRLRGRVVSMESGAPLRRAQVSIVSGEMQLRRVTTTDAEGRYEFAELPAGRFSVGAVKGGYVSLQYGQRRPYEGGTPVVLVEGQTVERLDLALPRGSVIAGRVTDEFGEPIASAQVQVLRQVYGPDGLRRPAPAGLETTDDRGEFRVFGLMPGEYLVNAGVRGQMSLTTASPASDVNEGYPPTYYPGTINPAEAQVVSLTVGQEHSVQFSLLPARMLRIAGTVVDSEGRPVTGAPVMLRSGSGMIGMMASAGMVGPEGSFSLVNVAPGEYVVEVRPPARPGTVAEFASVPVTVGAADVLGLRVVTGRGGRVSGRVVYEGNSARTSGLTPLRIFASAVDPTQPTLILSGDANGTVAEDGSFELAGITGKAYISVSLPAGWALKSVSLEGEDVTDEPLEFSPGDTISDVTVVLTDKLTDVSGQVIADRKPVTDYVVVIQPEEAQEGLQAARLIRLARPDTNGRFQLKGIRPGRYVATAVESMEQGRQFVPEFRERLRQSGRAFELSEGGRAELSLELVVGL